MGLRDFFRPRESAAQRAAWITDTVQRVGAQIAHQHIAGIRQAARSFEAAETPPWVENWPTTAGNINDDLARQLPTLRARARAAARNDDWAIGYIERLGDNVLGENGIPLQMALRKRNSEYDTDTNRLLESVFADWGSDCEVSGMSWSEVETLCLNAGPEDGEFLYRFRYGSGRYGIQIQVLDPALIDVTLNREFGGNRVRMGIEIDNDGKPLYYWLQASRVGDSLPDVVSVGKHIRLPVKEVRHGFVRRHIGQLRGYPWLSAGSRRLWLLHDFEESAAVASNNAAKRQGFFYTEDGDAPASFAETIVSAVLDQAKAAGKQLSAEEIQTIMASAEKYNTTMPGQFDTLPSNTRFQAFQSAWPNVQADTYVKGHLRAWLAARGMSYVTGGNDLESVNYSSARVGIVGEREHFKRVQQTLIAWLHAPVIREIMPYLVLATPKLRAERIDAYRAAAGWSPRRWQGIDPLKEANADKTNLANKLTSRRRIIIARGEDPDEVMREIAEEEKLYGPITPRTNKPDPNADPAAADPANQ